MNTTNWELEAKKKLKKTFAGFVKNTGPVSKFRVKRDLFVFVFLLLALTLFGFGVFTAIDNKYIAITVTVNKPYRQETITPTPASPTYISTETPTPATDSIYSSSERTFTDFDILLTKTIDGTTYAYIEVYADDILSHYFGSLTADGTAFTPISDNNLIAASFSESTRSFWYDSATNTLYLVDKLGRSREWSSSGPEIVYKINGIEDGTWNWEPLITVPVSRYASNDILNYDPETGSLLLKEFGGDSCAGWGRIWNLRDSIATELTKLALGCGDAQQPRYLGHNGVDVYLAEVSDKYPQPESENEWEYEYPVKRIYQINSVTGDVMTLREIASTDTTLYSHLAEYFEQSDIVIKDNQLVFKEAEKRNDGVYHYQIYDVTNDAFSDLDYTSEF